jgi:hydroxyacyl-ACP dehydratase HTD2-like protein with hotdog domain
MRITNADKIINAVLHLPQLSFNRRLYFADMKFTQLQALSLFEKYTNTECTINHFTAEKSFKLI